MFGNREIEKLQEEIDTLKTELRNKEIEIIQYQTKSLEVELENINEIRDKLLDTINDFNTQYILNLEDIIKKLLNIKEVFYYLQFKNSRDEEDYQQYQNIVESYNEFYSNENTVQVLESILEFSQNDINSYDSLSENIKNLKNTIATKTREIEEIKQSDSYAIIDTTENFEVFFESQKKEFEEEYQYISIQLQNIQKKEIEDSDYSSVLHDIINPNFDKIRRVNIDYINTYCDSDALFCQLNRGVKILEEYDELSQYIFSYSTMHKAKLYSSFDTVIHKLDNQTINIIDWGCGQALASTLLIDYIKEKQLNIDISNVILIEPSSIALSRGMLHIDILKENELYIKAINKDIDCLEERDLKVNNKNITLHLFSNILDVEFFRLDRAFLEKISNSQSGLNYFICVSPNINDKRNARLDMFYRYFDDNYKTELISSRESDIWSYKRYEKVFKATL